MTVSDQSMGVVGLLYGGISSEREISLQSGAAVAEARPQQPVVEMASIGIKRRAAIADAAHDHRRHVSQGQGEDQQRQKQADRGEFLGRTDQADGREAETKEVGAAIAHEDARRIEVVAQEADAGTCKGGCQQPCTGLMQAEAHGKQSHSGDGADTSCQAVEAIKPIDGVSDAHQPDHGGDQAEPVRQGEGQAAVERQGDRADFDALAPNRHGHADLQRETRQWWQLQQIVAEADGKKSYRTEKAAPDQLVATGGDGAKTTHQPGQTECQHESHHDGDATEPHHRSEMLLAWIRLIRQSPTQPELTHLRHDRRSD